jgi:hypothetical protein
MSKKNFKKNKKTLILMHFWVKSILKNSCYHAPKHPILIGREIIIKSYMSNIESK